MSMMAMVALLILIYFTSVAIIVFYSYKVKYKYGNLFFVILNVIFFLGLYIYYYKSSPNNFSFMTLDNISPFTFTTLPLIYIMHGKIKHYYLSAVAFLSVGMFCAMLITPQHSYLFNFNNTASFSYALDAFCHLNCSLFGIYLIASGQIKLTFKNLKIATIFMYCIVAGVVILNFLFHTNNFGMNPYGGYSIYMFNLFEDYWATLLAYIVGIFVVLCLGFGINYLMNKFSGNHLAFENKNNDNKVNEINEEEKKVE